MNRLEKQMPRREICENKSRSPEGKIRKRKEKENPTPI
jgi:hypothetical protein